MEKKLFRNEYDKVVAGVSSGLASYLQIDITIVRLLFVLSTVFLAGAGLITYIVMWIVVPVNNDPFVKYSKFNDFYEKSTPQTPFQFNETSDAKQTKWNTPNVGANFDQNKSNENLNKPKKDNDTGRTITGFVLLVLGVYFLLRQFDLIPYWFNIFKIYKLWPLAIIAVGASLILKNRTKNKFEAVAEEVKSEENVKNPQVDDHESVITEEDKKSN